MIRESDIVPLPWPDSKGLELIKKYSYQAVLEGRSNIWNEQERSRTCLMDQVIGVGFGEYLANQYFFGLQHYILSREYKNLTNTDDGCDTLGYKIDYKTSQIRHKQKRLSSYNLAVRDNELHDGHAYVLILILTNGLGPDHILHTRSRAWMMGWADSDMIRKSQRAQDGVFGPRFGKPGAYLIPAMNLMPISELKVQDFKL